MQKYQSVIYTHQILRHIFDLRIPEKCAELSCCLPQVKEDVIAKVVKVEDTQLLKHLEMLANEIIFVLKHVLRAYRWDWKAIDGRGLETDCKKLRLLVRPHLVCIVPYIFVLAKSICMECFDRRVGMRVDTWKKMLIKFERIQFKSVVYLGFPSRYCNGRLHAVDSEVLHGFVCSGDNTVWEYFSLRELTGRAS